MTTAAQARKIAASKARKYGLDVNIFLRQMNAEAAFQDHPPNGAGAAGWAQFMPGTARSMGVKNVHDPHEAYDGAARLMARLVKQTGSYERALRAYNAGPAAIEKSRGYAETNNYVAKILSNGRDPKKLGKPGKSSGGSSPSGARASGTRGGSVTATTRQPGTSYTVEGTKTEFDQEGFQKAQKLATLKSILGAAPGSTKNWGLLQSVLPESADPAAFTRTVDTSKVVKVPGSSTTVTRSVPGAPGATRPAAGGSKGGALPGLQGNGSKLLELIYNGQNKGYAVKDGKTVNGPQFYSGVWGGHANHVHVAAGPKTAVALGKLAQDMGLRVGENKHFDKVDPVHSPNSYHYRNMAIDVSGDPQKMAKYAARVKRIYGL